MWMLLIVALAVMTWFSFSDVDVALGGRHLRHSSIADALLRPEVTDLSDAVMAEVVDSDSISSAGIKSDRRTESVIDTLPKTILFLGDSMTQNLAIRMAKYCRWNNHELHAVNWDSSNTKIWSESDTITYFIDKFHPDIIFVCLGSNEVFLKNPEGHRKYVTRILDKIGNVPYIWIGPPAINGNPGITDMIQSAVRQGCYFRSTDLKLDRQPDHIHPTRSASATWLDSVAAWIPYSSIPFKMCMPPDTFPSQRFDLIYLKAHNKQ